MGQDGNTALIFAANEGHKEAVERLLERGADWRIKNKVNYTKNFSAHEHENILGAYTLQNGFTALKHAVEGGYNDIAQLLENKVCTSEILKQVFVKVISL